RSEEHTSELQSHLKLVCRILHEKPREGQQARPSTPPRPHQRLARLRLRPAAPAQEEVFFNDTPTTEIYTLSLHDALPICSGPLQPVTCPGASMAGQCLGAGK